MSDDLVLHADEATVTNEWVPVSRVRVIRRIVTEIQTIDVEVRREELVVTEEPIDPAVAEALPAGRAPVTPEPMVYVLLAEVPSVSLTTRPVERVTVMPVVVAGERTIDLAMQKEILDLDVG